MVTAIIIVSFHLSFWQHLRAGIPIIFVYAIFFLLFGNFLAKNSSPNFTPLHFSHYPNNSELEIQLSNKSERANSIRFEGNVTSSNSSKTQGKLLVYLQKDSLSLALKEGAKIKGSVHFRKIKNASNPHAYSPHHHYKTKGIYHQTFLSHEEWEVTPSKSSFFTNWISYLHENFRKKIEYSRLGQQEKDVAYALFLGDKTALDDVSKSSFAIAGAMHILAVSGLHVGIILILFTFLLKPLEKFRKGIYFKTVIIIFCIWIYAFITGASSAVLRASLMFSFIAVAQSIHRKQSIYQAILVSAIILILIQPFIIFDIGFQLSYTAVIGIIYLQPKITALITIRNKFILYFWKIIAVSLAAQIATLPLSLFYFHQFPTYFLLTNILVIPLSFIILLVGVCYLIFDFIPGLNYLLEISLNYLLFLLNKSVQFIAQLPFAAIKNIHISLTQVIFSYFILASLFGRYIHRKKYLGLTAVVLGFGLVLFSIIRLTAIQSSREIVFYSTFDGVAIDLREGQQTTFISTPNNALGTDDYNFNIHPNHLYNHSFLKSELVQNNTFHSWNGVNFVIASENHEFQPINFLYLYNCQFLSFKTLENLMQFKTTIIIGNKCSYAFKSFLYGNYPKEKIHDLSQEGALVYPLNF